MEKSLGAFEELNSLPGHVAIVMDGNGRWAQQRNLPRHSGHKAGVEVVRSSIEVCLKHKIKVLTLFAFSSENWRRPKNEVNLLLDLFMTSLSSEIRRLQENDIKIKFIGDISAFPQKLQKKIYFAESETSKNKGLILQVAANYGGRWDIKQAIQKIAEKVSEGLIKTEEINEDLISQYTSFSQVADPDLFIRTGGDFRISNFLLWHSAYTEFYFTPVLWPDFSEKFFEEALEEFAHRQRRFGKTSEQVQAAN
tara:strand:- start:19909 stop:20664 length:756 start_codon:yes stop_codon:yes gene_type:complete